MSAIEDIVCNEFAQLEIDNKLKEVIISSVKTRARVGEVKYGVTLERDDLTELEWCNHLQEELLDALNYATRIQMISEKHQEELLFGEMKAFLLYFAVQMQKMIELEKAYQNNEASLHAQV